MKGSAILIIALLAGSGTDVTATTPGEDEDAYDVWEPVYAMPAGTGKAGKATISTCAPELPAPLTPVKEFSILGEPEFDAQTLWLFVRRHNADFPIEIAETFLEVGSRYGIRGDIALCQAIIETGWFRFADGTAVKPEQHNYCGLGVTGRGMTGSSFESISDGVTAHIQHLYAYATTTPLPSGERLLDPRFSLVARGVARTWHDLSNRWAMNPNYGRQIFDLYTQLRKDKDKN